MAIINGFLPIEVKEADDLEVNFNQSEQEIEIILKKNGETLKTKVIKLTNSKLKKFWTGSQEGPIINIGSDFVGIQEQDFYYNVETDQLYIVTVVNIEEEVSDSDFFIVVKVDHKYIKPVDPPLGYDDDDFIYEQGDIWINSESNNVWILASVSGEDTEITYNWTPIGVSGSASNNYNLLINKPTINERELRGALTSQDLNIPTFDDLENKQDKLTPGPNITIIDGVISANDIEPLQTSYNNLLDKPSINNITIDGSMSSESLGLATVEAVNTKQDALTAGSYVEIENGVISISIPNKRDTIVSTTNAPSNSNVQSCEIGDTWVNKTNNRAWLLTSVNGINYNWKEL